MKPWHLLGLLAILTLASGILSTSAAASASTIDRQTLAKIEPLVPQEIQAASQTDFFVWMVEEADLSPADQLETKAEKGHFVYQTLRQTAEHSQKDLRAYLDRQGADYCPFYIVDAILIRGGDQALLQAVATRSDVSRISANHQFQLQTPLDPGITAVEPNLIFVNADDVWAMGITGQGTVLVNNGTGLDETHPAIKSHYRGCLDPPTCSTWDHNYNWWDATGTYPTDPYDGNNHGTFTSGVMVGDDGGTNQIGMAPGAQTIHCKCLYDGGFTYDDMLFKCLEWDLAPWDLSGADPRPDLAADALNITWSYWSAGQTRFRPAIQALQAAGIMVVVPAGGGGPGCGTLRSPADYGEVLTVGAVDSTGGVPPGTLSPFSGRGPSSLDPSPPYWFPDVLAPGVNIRSSINIPSQTCAIWSGTGPATPHATGLVGLCWSANPALRDDIAATTHIITSTAMPLSGQTGSCGGDYMTSPNNDWGYGAIDALAAVQACLAYGNTGGLDGHVYDAQTLTSLQDALVTAQHSGGGTWDDTTDPTGYYSLPLTSGTYTVTASYPNHTPAITTGVEVISGGLTTLNFYLQPTGLLQGTVTGGCGAGPLQATVAISGPDPLTQTLSDPTTGYYSAPLIAGGYDLTFNAAGYLSHTASVSVTLGQTTTLDVSLLPDRPCIGVQPDSFEAQLVSGTLVYTHPTSLDISNDGGRALSFTLSADAPWVWAVPASGTVPPEGSIAATRNVEIVFTTLLIDPLPPGTYSATLQLAHDDPTTDSLSIQALLQVTAQPVSPTASFQSNSPVCLGEPTDFTNTTTGTSPIDYLWSFGDGLTSTLESPSHVYALNGTYTVTLLAQNAYGSDVASDTVQVRPLPQAGFSYTADLLTVTFSNTSLNADTYLWDFGDGGTDTVENPMHVYAAKGSYTVTLRASGDCGSNVVSDTITVFDCYELDAVTIQGPVYGYPSLYFFSTTYSPPYATGPISYTWDNGDTDTISIRNLAMGSHTLTVSATNCFDTLVTDTHTILIVEADIEVTPPLPGPPVFAGQSYTQLLGIANAGNLSLTWSLTEEPAVDWLGEDITGTTLSPMSGVSVELTFDATGLTPGEYTTGLRILSDDRDQPIVYVPLMLRVREPCLEITGVSLTLALSGTLYAGAPIQFSADVAPDDATKPYSYTVLYGDETIALPYTSTLDPLVLSHTYAVAGDYTVELGVWNCDMSAPLTDTLALSLRPPLSYSLYLPVVLKEN